MQLTLEDSKRAPSLSQSLDAAARRHCRTKQVAVLPFGDVLQWVLTSEIRDSMAMIAVLIAARQRTRQQPQ
ncbi:MAG: hypothetical protein HY868_02845 [Chloroflexi bacterium]|nr:hypothetical protein [Chloroflexota bacterium]